jgi:hypothetical protein
VFFNFSVSFPLQETFAEYTARTAFDRPLLSGVAYAQRVVNSERDQFEKQHGVVIKTMVEREASPIRDEYAPVIFAQETLSYLESIDMMSGEVNNNTFEPLPCLLFCVRRYFFTEVSHLHNAGGPREHYES